MNAILQDNPSDTLQMFLSDFGSFREIDEEKISAICRSTVRWKNVSKAQPDNAPELVELERRWYDSLPEPDYAVYDTDEYVGDLWSSWIIYSRKYLTEIQQDKSMPPAGIVGSMGHVRRVVDLGCGCGHSTAALAQLFPEAEVVGTNLDGTVQMSVARVMGDRYGFSMAATVMDAEGQTDLVFASEYFEHIRSPISHLFEVVEYLQPQYLLIANSFGTLSTGHFVDYEIFGRTIDGRRTSKLFNKALRKLGYDKMQTALWNSRPMFWRKRRSGQT